MTESDADGRELLPINPTPAQQMFFNSDAATEEPSDE